MSGRCSLAKCEKETADHSESLLKVAVAAAQLPSLLSAQVQNPLLPSKVIDGDRRKSNRRHWKPEGWGRVVNEKFSGRRRRVRRTGKVARAVKKIEEKAEAPQQLLFVPRTVDKWATAQVPSDIEWKTYETSYRMCNPFTYRGRYQPTLGPALPGHSLPDDLTFMQYSSYYPRGSFTPSAPMPTTHAFDYSQSELGKLELAFKRAKSRAAAKEIKASIGKETTKLFRDMMTQTESIGDEDDFLSSGDSDYTARLSDRTHGIKMIDVERVFANRLQISVLSRDIKDLLARLETDEFLLRQLRREENCDLAEEVKAARAMASKLAGIEAQTEIQGALTRDELRDLLLSERTLYQRLLHAIDTLERIVSHSSQGTHTPESTTSSFDPYESVPSTSRPHVTDPLEERISIEGSETLPPLSPSPSRSPSPFTSPSTFVLRRASGTTMLSQESDVRFELPEAVRSSVMARRRGYEIEKLKRTPTLASSTAEELHGSLGIDGCNGLILLDSTKGFFYKITPTCSTGITTLVIHDSLNKVAVNVDFEKTPYELEAGLTTFNSETLKTLYDAYRILGSDITPAQDWTFSPSGVPHFMWGGQSLGEFLPGESEEVAPANSKGLEWQFLHLSRPAQTKRVIDLLKTKSSCVAGVRNLAENLFAAAWEGFAVHLKSLLDCDEIIVGHIDESLRTTCQRHTYRTSENARVGVFLFKTSPTLTRDTKTPLFTLAVATVQGKAAIPADLWHSATNNAATLRAFRSFFYV